jgi:hypothetical protein
MGQEGGVRPPEPRVAVAARLAIIPSSPGAGGRESGHPDDPLPVSAARVTDRVMPASIRSVPHGSKNWCKGV